MNSSAHRTWSWPVIVIIVLTPLEVYSFDLVVLPLYGAASISPVFMVMLLLLPVLVLGVLVGRTARIVNPLTLLYLGYLSVGLMGLLTVQSPQAVVAWGGSALMFLACVYTLAYIDTVQKLEMVLTTCIIVGFGVALMGLIEFVGYVVFNRIIEPPFAPAASQLGHYGFADDLMRMYGFFNGTNRIGSYLLIPFGLCFYRFTTARARRGLYGALVVYFGVVIVLSLSRNAQLALFVFLVATWLFNLTRVQVHATVAVVCTAVLVGGGLVLLHPVTGVWWVDRLNPWLEVESGALENLRLLSSHFRTSAAASVMNFGLGRGLTNYDDWAYAQGVVTEWGAHSSFLYMLGETGLVGFALHIAIILYLFHVSFRCWRGGGSRGRCAAYLVSVLLGLITAGIVRTFYLAESTLILMALIVINARLGHHEFAMAVAPRVALPIEGEATGDVVSTALAR